MKQIPSDHLIECPYCGMHFREGATFEPRYTDRMCMVCGHAWRSRGDALPRRCPSCRSTEWNVSMRKEVECRKCGHRWVPRGGCVPSKCPKCKSPSWSGAKVDPRQPEEDLLRAVSMYSEGAGCVEASLATGVPVEDVVKKVLSLSGGPVRMLPADPKR